MRPCAHPAPESISSGTLAACGGSPMLIWVAGFAASGRKPRHPYQPPCEAPLALMSHRDDLLSDAAKGTPPILEELLGRLFQARLAAWSEAGQVTDTLLLRRP